MGRAALGRPFQPLETKEFMSFPPLFHPQAALCATVPISSVMGTRKSSGKRMQ